MRLVYLPVFVLMLLPLQPAFGEAAQTQDDTAQIDDSQSDQDASSDLPPLEKPAVPEEKPSTAAPLPESRPPDLIAFGMSSVDFDKGSSSNPYKNDGRTRTTDFRLEYHWGYSLYSAQADWGFDFGIHPFAGGMATMHGQHYGFGGFAFDWVFLKHIVVTESEAVGLFDSGNPKVAKPLGSVVEFRSQLELGWRFDNDMRITAQIGHISNAGLTHSNPGMEIAGGYVYIPSSYLFDLFSR